MKNKLVLLLLGLLAFVFIFSFTRRNEENSTSEDVTNITKSKINGIALEAPRSEFDQVVFKEFNEISANWVCLMPYAYNQDGESTISYNLSNYQWWGERKVGIEKSIQLAREKNLKVMIKPHLWIRHGSFTGDKSFDTESDWLEWETDYQNYILDYAEVAERLNVEMYCIGTELREFVKQRPEFWSELILEVKKIYSGKLTYAGNWDSYKYFPHWDQLDYIGVDAYFPLSVKKTPQKEELIEGWQKWKKEMEKISLKQGRPILFTEFGYCSATFACKEPWIEDKSAEVHFETQALAFDALFETFWSEDWFSGGFIWKWHTPDHLNSNRHQKRFTPQEKEAIDIIQNWFSKSK